MNSKKQMHDREATGRRMRVNWGLLWTIPIVAACLGLVFSLAGKRVTSQALDVDPCATSADNPFVYPVLISYAVLIVGSFVATVVSAIARNVLGVVVGVFALVFSLFLAIVGLILTVGSYGWHCPNY